MAELIDPSNYQDFTLQTIMTPDGITRINNILRQLSQNISGDTESVRVFSGVGTPEASVSAGIGSLYMRTDGGTDTSVYRKESGSGNTGWVAVKAPASLPLSTANGGLGADASAWTAGDILYLSATGVIGHRSSLTNIQVFTANGTWTKPASGTLVYVKVWGGGGAGGNTNTNGSTAGGGGGGGYSEGYTAVTTDVTVTVGAAGAGSASNNAAGGNGGTSSFAGTTTIQATGGTGGSGGSGGSGGAGGVGSNGQINFTGETGQGGSGTLGLGYTGQGGSSYGFAGAKAPLTFVGNGVGITAAGYGAGGSTGMKNGGGASGQGGDGAGGLVIVYY